MMIFFKGPSASSLSFNPNELTLSLIHQIGWDYEEKYEKKPSPFSRLLYCLACSHNPNNTHQHALAHDLISWKPREYTPREGWLFLVEALKNTIYFHGKDYDDFGFFSIGEAIWQLFKEAFQLDLPIPFLPESLYRLLLKSIHTSFPPLTEVHDDSLLNRLSSNLA